jgi:Flp pilus assembly protein TadB
MKRKKNTEWKNFQSSHSRFSQNILFLAVVASVFFLLSYTYEKEERERKQQTRIRKIKKRQNKRGKKPSRNEEQVNTVEKEKN